VISGDRYEKLCRGFAGGIENLIIFFFDRVCHMPRLWWTLYFDLS